MVITSVILIIVILLILAYRKKKKEYKNFLKQMKKSKDQNLNLSYEDGDRNNSGFWGSKGEE